jgi:fluoride exporter
MIKNILLVAFGGATGSVLRYLTYYFLPLKTINKATLIVNILGSLFMGLLAGYFSKNHISNHLQYLLIVGFCGGFTTFSAFSWDVFMLFQQQKIFLAICYTLAMLVLAVLFTYFGYLISK